MLFLIELFKNAECQLKDEVLFDLPISFILIIPGAPFIQWGIKKFQIRFAVISDSVWGIMKYYTNI